MDYNKKYQKYRKKYLDEGMSGGGLFYDNGAIRKDYADKDSFKQNCVVVAELCGNIYKIHTDARKDKAIKNEEILGLLSKNNGMLKNFGNKKIIVSLLFLLDFNSGLNIDGATYDTLKGNYMYSDDKFNKEYIIESDDTKKQMLNVDTIKENLQNMKVWTHTPFFSEDFWDMDITSFFEECDKYEKTGTSQILFWSNIANFIILMCKIKTSKIYPIFDSVDKKIADPNPINNKNFMDEINKKNDNVDKSMLEINYSIQQPMTVGEHEFSKKNRPKLRTWDSLFQTTLKNNRCFFWAFNPKLWREKKDTLINCLIKSMSFKKETINLFYTEFIQFLYESANYVGHISNVESIVSFLENHGNVYLSCIFTSPNKFVRHEGTKIVISSVTPTRVVDGNIFDVLINITHDFFGHKLLDKKSKYTDKNRNEFRIFYNEILQEKNNTKLLNVVHTIFHETICFDQPINFSNEELKTRLYLFNKDVTYKNLTVPYAQCKENSLEDYSEFIKFYARKICEDDGDKEKFFLIAWFVGGKTKYKESLYSVKKQVPPMSIHDHQQKHNFAKYEYKIAIINTENGNITYDDVVHGDDKNKLLYVNYVLEPPKPK